MGLLGVYMAVNQKTLNHLIEINGDAILEELDELEETNETYNIDKLWDGLHFLLTGFSASTPIAGDKLSEAIIGVTVFDTNEDDFVSYTKNEDLPAICNALKSVNIKELEEKFDPKILKKNKIYPQIWATNKKNELFAELINEYNCLLDFYEMAREKNLNVIFSVL